VTGTEPDSSHYHIEHGKAGKRSDVHLLNPDLIIGSNANITSYISTIGDNIKSFRDRHLTYKEERRIFDGFKKEKVINGHRMKINKKMSTIKTDFEKAVRLAGISLNLTNITPHSARKFYCNSVYTTYATFQNLKLTYT
jgi:hypothetical protein